MRVWGVWGGARVCVWGGGVRAGCEGAMRDLTMRDGCEGAMRGVRVCVETQELHGCEGAWVCA